jgi:calcineurin-like phosphoesterase family protein
VGRCDDEIPLYGSKRPLDTAGSEAFMTLWFTADTHFGHRNIIDMCSRPFADAEEMDERLILNWNKRVQPRDHVWFLGDFALHKNRVRLAEIFGRLNGVKNLIRGNHDGNRIMELGWEQAKDMHMLSLDGSKVILCHYGLRSWASMYHGSYHLYGHSHGNLPSVGRSLDVGVDCWDYAPVSFEEIKVRLEDAPNYAPDASPRGKPIVED